MKALLGSLSSVEYQNFIVCGYSTPISMGCPHTYRRSNTTNWERAKSKRIDGLGDLTQRNTVLQWCGRDSNNNLLYWILFDLSFFSWNSSPTNLLWKNDMKKMKKMKKPRLTVHKYVERNCIAVFLLIIFTLSGCSAKGISVRRRVTRQVIQLLTPIAGIKWIWLHPVLHSAQERITYQLRE